MKARIYFDGRKQISSGEDKGRSHIKILVEFDDVKRLRRYYKTEIFATREEYDKIITGKFGRSSEAERRRLGEKRKTLLALEAKAKSELRAGMAPEAFEILFLSKGSLDNPLDALLAYSEELKNDGQVGTAAFYKSAYSGFKAFAPGGRLSYVQVTPRWLKSYENHLLDLGKSISTVGTHVRPMRTIFKKAIDAGLIPVSMYPFGRNKYRVPASKGRKIALTEIEKNIILEYKGDYQQAVDMWKFSYFCNGMNFNDIARLKRSDVVDGILTFDRVKTKNTERNKEPIIITMHAEAIRIINKWGVADLSPGAYIFPVLQKGLTPTQERNRIADWIKDTNEALGVVIDKINENREKDKLPKITTYWARHTFATVLKRKGMSIEYIQEALGHSSPETTKVYLDGFDLETKRKATGLL
jgi:integrase/recombinase XerD